MADDGDQVVKLMMMFRAALDASGASESVRGTAVGLLVGRVALMSDDPEAAFMGMGTVAGNVIAASPLHKPAASGAVN